MGKIILEKTGLSPLGVVIRLVLVVIALVLAAASRLLVRRSERGYR